MIPVSLIPLDPEINQTNVDQQNRNLLYLTLALIVAPPLPPTPKIPSAVLSGMFPICSPRPCQENSLIDPTPNPGMTRVKCLPGV